MDRLLTRSKFASAHFFIGSLNRAVGMRLLETVLVTITAIAVIKILVAGYNFRFSWLIVPCVLTAGALIPTLIRGGDFDQIGIRFEHPWRSLALLGWVCIFAFPLVFVGFWLLKSYGLGLPLYSVPSHPRSWIAWVIYQFLYVAVTEEFFFRGYVQGNILRLKGRQGRFWEFMSIVISAGCFGLAHIVIHGQLISGLTFIPGVILAWLFLRTRSLLAPVLFHGLANAWYLIILSIL